jgi:RNA polymerase sigma factor (sigma-70 family)
MNELNLDAVARAALGGDAAALEELCRRTQGPIYRLALRMLGHVGDAEDATQEILVLVVTHLVEFRGQSKLSTWVYTIASRHLLRFRHSRAELRTAPLDEVAGAIDSGLSATHPQDLPEGDVRVLARDVRRTCTQAMLLGLTREERLAVILAEMLGATDRVGADLCDVEPAAFRQRLARARAKLRPILEERCGLAGDDRPCRCERQAAAKQKAGLRLPVYDDAVDGLLPAEAELGGLARVGGVFAVEPPPAPRRELWAALRARFPELLA